MIEDKYCCEGSSRSCCKNNPDPFKRPDAFDLGAGLRAISKKSKKPKKKSFWEKLVELAGKYGAYGGPH